MHKSTLLLVLTAVTALLAGIYVHRLSQAPVGGGQAVKPLDVSFPDASAILQPLGQWQGKLLIINFWATWCAPCLKEIPEFIKLQEEYREHGLQFVGVAIDDRQSVLSYLQGVNVNYPVLIAGDGGIDYARKLGNIINAVPYTVVVNQPGEIVERLPGEISPENLRRIITPLLGLK
jgi:thiol-disulfide isomerase/thioredoxin